MYRLGEAMNLILTHIGAQFRGVPTPAEWRIKTPQLDWVTDLLDNFFTTSKPIFVLVFMHQLLCVEQHLVSFQISNFYIGWHFIFLKWEHLLHWLTYYMQHFWNGRTFYIGRMIQVVDVFQASQLTTAPVGIVNNVKVHKEHWMTISLKLYCWF